MTGPFPITELDQLEALTSPVRGEIVDILELMGPFSMAEIAEAMGRPVDSLYYHVRRLIEGGRVIEIEKRKASRQEEAVFDLPGRPMFVEYRPSQSDFVQVLKRSIGGMLRMARRDFNAAFEKGLVRGSGRDRNIVHSRALGWFTDQEVLEMRSEIQEVVSRFRSSAQERRKDSHLYALTSILVPLEKRK